MGRKVNVLRNDTPGRVFVIDEADVADAIANRGYHLESEGELKERAGREFDEDVYGGAVGTAGAVIGSTLKGFTGGLSDVYTGLAQGDTVKDFSRESRKQNETLSTVAEIGGSLIPNPIGIAGRAGSAIAKGGAAVAKTGLKDVARSIAGGAVEGALQGVGEGASELALSDDPLTLERATSTLSSRALFGGAVGGAAGGAGKLLEKGLVKSKALVDDYIARQTASANVAGDLVGLDTKGLRAARDAELAAIEGARVPERQSLASDIATFRAETKEQKLWLATKGSTDAETRVIGKQTLKADRQLDALLDNPKALAERPQRALDALEKQEHALTQLQKKDPAIRAAAEADRLKDTGIPMIGDDIGEEGLTRTVNARDLHERGYYEPPGGGVDKVRMENARKAIAEGQQTAIKAYVGPDGLIEISDGRHRLAAAIEADAPIKVRFDRGTETVGKHGVVLQQGAGSAATSSARVAALDAVVGALEKNRAFQERIRASISDPMSDRLKQIADAQDALTANAGKKPGIGEQILGGSVFSAVAGVARQPPFVGGLIAPLAGAAASGAATDLVFGRLGNAAKKAAERTSQVIDKFIGVMPTVQKAAPVLATKILSHVRYAPIDEKRERKAEVDRGGRGEKLHESFTARADELRSQVVPDMTGTLRMRPEARERVAAMLGGVRVRNPLVADQMETIAARRVEYLASILPKQPDLPSALGSKAGWRAPDMVMRSFARSVAATEDPDGVEDRLVDGTITPEDADAYKAVCPERAAALTQSIIEALPRLRGTLPYKRRLALSMFAGVAVDPAMDPQIFARLQASFALEPGTEGGTQAPKPAPAFGSVKKSAPQPTPAQERAS